MRVTGIASILALTFLSFSSASPIPSQGLSWREAVAGPPPWRNSGPVPIANREAGAPPWRGSGPGAPIENREAAPPWRSTQLRKSGRRRQELKDPPDGKVDVPKLMSGHRLNPCHGPLQSTRLRELNSVSDLMVVSSTFLPLCSRIFLHSFPLLLTTVSRDSSAITSFNFVCDGYDRSLFLVSLLLSHAPQDFLRFGCL
ncbi:hypothetical protein FA13DRAFT_826413 [Coprinellus micaceus]|uniref:Uncharacterized protein n=1 Tax=Coprinellus micaceus TaxID=71717 RepID=A0A4Y7T253_COPMI|nr:hypothetical protein FA13DRAFT_826413 [Coprinellus micaceus]